MTKLLASVTGPREAEIALAGGADLIDLKDPSQGALGAVTPEILCATITTVAGRRPVSAVTGDLPMEPDTVRAAVEARTQAQYVKIGLFPAARPEREVVIRALAPTARDTKLIAVFFADGEPDFDLLSLLRESGFAGAMIDTMAKADGRLLTHLSVAALGDFLARCRELGLMSGLAGSLEPPDVPRLLPLRPDYLGFRGALTAGRRDGPIDAGAIARIRALLDQPHGGKASTNPAADGGCDRIFVRDFTLPLEIGAYGFERGRVQKVRFSVEADIERLPPNPQGMEDIYSYDLILDAIRTLAASGHTDLVETLAVRLADAVLADARVRRVQVKVEKLELGPEAVGVEIVRSRRCPTVSETKD